jgi:ParB family transcriptional regulator, chromosome partitioning protein
VVRHSGLGKGLGALIPSATEERSDRPNNPAIPSGPGSSGGSATGSSSTATGQGGDGLAQIPLSSIVPSRFQTREVFDEASLEELAASIREVGVLQPILVRPQDNGTFELVAGERRWRAARRAGLSSIPALVRETADKESVLHVLIENLQREDLDALEEASGYQQLIAELNLTHEQIAARVGRSRAAVTNSLRLLQLTPSIQKLIKTRELSAGHARTLLQVTDKNFQDSLARKAVSEGMTVRALETAIQLRNDLASGKSGKIKSPKSGSASATNADKPAGLLELEEILGAQFDTRVNIDFGTKNGKIIIEFADLEDLERIFSVMTGESATNP